MADIEQQAKADVATVTSTVKAYAAKYSVIVLVAIVAFIIGRIV